MNLDSATKRNPFHHLTASATKPNAILRDSPPFRSGGRGSKQVAAALERTAESPQVASNEKKYAFFDGRASPCFVRIVNEKQFGGVLVQPLRANPLDPNYYIAWEGHMWMAMRSKLHPVEVRVHAQGLEVVNGPPVMYTFLSKGKDNGFRYPVTSQERTQQNLPPDEVDDNWDVISLESGETLSAIPKHTFPTSTKPSAFKLPEEILVGGNGTGAMKTPMVKMRPFPATDGDFAYPAPPNSRVEPTVTPASVTSSSSSSNITSSINAALDATTAAAALAAAVGITVDDKDEFARFVQLAITNFHLQKSAQRPAADTNDPPLSSQSTSMAATAIAGPPSGPISFSPETLPHEASAANVPVASTPESFSTSTARNATEVKGGEASPPTAAQTPVYTAIGDSPSATEGGGPPDVTGDAINHSESPSAMDIDVGVTEAAEATEPVVVEIPLRWHSESLPSPPVATVGVAATDRAEESVVEVAVVASTGVRRTGRRYRPTAGANEAPHLAAAATDNASKPLTAVGSSSAKRGPDSVEASPDSVSGVLSPVARSVLLTPSPQLPKKAVAAAADATFVRRRRSMGPPPPPSNDEAPVETPARGATSSTTSTVLDKTPLEDHNRATLETAVSEVAESKPPRPPRKRAHPPPPPPPPPSSSSSSSSGGGANSHQSQQERQAPTSDDEGFVRGRKRSRREAELAMLLDASDAPKGRHRNHSNSHSHSQSQSHDPGRRHNGAASGNRPPAAAAVAAVSKEGVAAAAAETSRQERRARSTSIGQQRDAFLGSWPNRKQSAATGHWRI